MSRYVFVKTLRLPRIESNRAERCSRATGCSLRRTGKPIESLSVCRSYSVHMVAGAAASSGERWLSQPSATRAVRSPPAEPSWCLRSPLAVGPVGSQCLCSRPQPRRCALTPALKQTPRPKMPAERKPRSFASQSAKAAARLPLEVLAFEFFPEPYRRNRPGCPRCARARDQLTGEPSAAQRSGSSSSMRLLGCSSMRTRTSAR